MNNYGLQLCKTTPQEGYNYCITTYGQHHYRREQEHIRMVARVRACNSVKFETGRNLPPVVKIVTRILGMRET